MDLGNEEMESEVMPWVPNSLPLGSKKPIPPPPPPPKATGEQKAILSSTSENKKLRQQLAAVEARAFAFDKMTFELNDKLAATEARAMRVEGLLAKAESRIQRLIHLCMDLYDCGSITWIKSAIESTRD